MEIEIQVTPPPPPPPPVAAFTANRVNEIPLLNYRIQLLHDIQKGKTLRKGANPQNGLNSRPLIKTNQISSSNECNGIDSNNYNEENTANPIKNQLQAELCSTLHRRQNGGSNKPKFIMPKNTTINAINNQLREMQNNTPSTTNGTETVPVTQPSAANAKEDKPKLMISHGKPNFKISSNSISSKVLLQKNENFKNSDEVIGTLRRRLKSTEALDECHKNEKLDVKTLDSANFVKNEQKNITKTEVTNDIKLPISPPVFYKASVKNYNSVTNNFSSTESNNQISKVPISPPVHHKASVSSYCSATNNISSTESNNEIAKLPTSSPVFQKTSVRSYSSATNNISSTESTNEISRTIRRLKSVELLEQIEKSNDEKAELNDIQKKIQKLKTVELNKSHSHSIQSPDNINQNNKSLSNSQNSVTEIDCFQSSPVLPRRAQLFKQQQNLGKPKLTSPTIHHINHGTLNFITKPVTSFSRDLQLTPNRYPDKVPVMKPTEPEPVFFSDIKFTINSSGEVEQRSN